MGLLRTMTSQNNSFPQQQTVPGASVSGNMNMPSPVPYPQQSAYNPYYPQPQGSHYPQQPGPSVYGPTPVSYTHLRAHETDS